MKALLGLGLVGAIALSGCCSIALHGKIFSNQKDIENGPDTLQAQIPDQPTHLVCAPVENHLYKIQGSATPVWLRFPRHESETAILQDLEEYLPKYSSRRSDSAPASPLPPLDLVIANSSAGFTPKDSAGAPLRAMLLVPPTRSPGDSQSVFLGDPSVTLIYSIDGTVQWAAVEIHTPRFKPAQQRANTWRWAPLYLVTIPVDILTSPLQLTWVLFSGKWLSGILAFM